MKKIFFIVLFISCCHFTFGQQLVYTPINPAFGGNSFNYQWLLSAAEAQNTFTDPDEAEAATELEAFQESLNSQLLGSLTRSVFNSQLGEGLEEGTFVVGDLSLEIFETTEGLVVNILDTNTGEQTQIVVPN